MDKQALILPILLITVGVGWLLSTLGVTPDINWVWTLGLLVASALTFVIYGFDKVTLSSLSPAPCRSSGRLGVYRPTSRFRFSSS